MALEIILPLCSALATEVPAQSLHVGPGVHLNTLCMRIIIWDGVLWVRCSFAEFPVLANIICKIIACALKTCLHLKNNFLENNSPLPFPLSQTTHSCPELYISFLLILS